MLRTGRGSFVYAGLARGLALALARGETAATYVRAGFGDFVPGLSDVDLAIVVPDRAARRRVIARWERLWRPRTWLRELFDVAVYEDAVLAEAAAASTLTYDLGRTEPRAAYFGATPVDDECFLRERPRLYGPLRDWQLLSGVERRPALADQTAAERRIAAWLELQAWWRHAFDACVDPSGPRKAYLCVKLVAEPARIWLWLVHGERIDRRRDVLVRAREALPEDERAFGDALALLDALPGGPAAPLDRVLPPFVRLTARIAERIGEEVREAGTNSVPLLGRRSRLTGEGLPLVDWRSLVWPSIPDETFVLAAGDPADPADVAAATPDIAGPYRTLRAQGVLFSPHGPLRADLRGVQSAVTDPVSVALLDGSDTAEFANVPGWSARDWARRAVAEHRAWLRDGREQAELTLREWPDTEARHSSRGVRTLGRLFTAGRAAHFLEAGELALSAAAVADVLGVGHAFEEYRAARSGAHEPGRVVAEVRERVAGLRAYVEDPPRLEHAA
jgi:hypothetical protein